MSCLAAVALTQGLAAPGRSAAETASPDTGEHLGSVSFPVSCAAAVQEPFNRGVALLHDFWYEEAKRQFENILKTDPACVMAHWGIAMSVFHQLWDRPDGQTIALGWKQLKAALAHPAKTARERDYVAALAAFFRPGQKNYSVRIRGYAAAMQTLYARHPDDTDAGAFYALALLAAIDPDVAGLAAQRKAIEVLKPLYGSHPDHPGVLHYMIHACDSPTLALQGLDAARRYGEVASSGPHAVHMPGHIFARLGLWQSDIDVNLASVAAAHAAEARHQGGIMDQFHSDDFLIYAYLQSGREASAHAVITDATALFDHYDAMPPMADHTMTWMFPFYRTKFPVFYSLETRDWKSAAALEPVKGAAADQQLLTLWARAEAHGHLREPAAARADLARYDALIVEAKKDRHDYDANSTGARITRGEMLAWIAFAEGRVAEALKLMRDAADLQDQVGQGEVDIPAREMLADMLLESGQPKDALIEYRRDLAQSPNRFNGVFNAGQAAESAGDTASAQGYYALLLKFTDNGAHSTRPELGHAKRFVATNPGEN